MKLGKEKVIIINKEIEIIRTNSGTRGYNK